jgi:hypothetical protein
MTSINVYPLRSDLSYEESISKETASLLKELASLTDCSFNLVSLEELPHADLSLYLIQSGGSENKFKELANKTKGPYYLLTYGENNSLAASLEILAYLNEKGEQGEILHGSNQSIAKRITELLARSKDKVHQLEKKNNHPINPAKAPFVRLGVIGKPSDWLIASDVDYKKAQDEFGICLIDIPTSRLIEDYKKNKDEVPPHTFASSTKEMTKAYRVYTSLKKIIEEEKLEGLTIRCFDLLPSLKTTACLALSLLNRDGYIASCEGDIPSMITSYLIRKIAHESSFQANPCYIDKEKETILLAHCTLPLDMASSYCFNTHFESNIGIGIHGEMKEGRVTILKIAPSLDYFYCEEGTLIKNQYQKNLCRTQIIVKLDKDIDYFFTHPLANHHLVCYGNHKEEFISYLTKLGLQPIQ